MSISQAKDILVTSKLSHIGTKKFNYNLDKMNQNKYVFFYSRKKLYARKFWVFEIYRYAFSLKF